MEKKVYLESASFGQPTGKDVPAIFIQAGLSKNNRMYPAPVLESGAPHFMNVPVFVDHAGFEEAFDRPERSMKDLVGMVREARFGTFIDREGKQVQGIGGTIRVASHAQWLLDMASAGVGGDMSIVAALDMEVDPQTGIYNVKEILQAVSVDFVTRGAAGGQILGEAAYFPVTLTPEGTVLYKSGSFVVSESEEGVITVAAYIHKEPDISGTPPGTEVVDSAPVADPPKETVVLPVDSGKQKLEEAIAGVQSVVSAMAEQIKLAITQLSALNESVAKLTPVAAELTTETVHSTMPTTEQIDSAVRLAVQGVNIPVEAIPSITLRVQANWKVVESKHPDKAFDALLEVAALDAVKSEKMYLESFVPPVVKNIGPSTSGTESLSGPDMQDVLKKYGMTVLPITAVIKE